MTHAGSEYTSGRFRGTLKQILADYSKKYDLTLALQDPVGAASLLGLSQDHTTELREKEFHKQANESDTAFLTRIMEAYGISEASGKAGYWMMSTSEPGPGGGTPQATLRLVNPQSAPHSYEWTVQAKDSTVIEWAPDIAFGAITPLGGESLVGAVLRPDYGPRNDARLHPGDGQRLYPAGGPGRP